MCRGHAPEPSCISGAFLDEAIRLLIGLSPAEEKGQSLPTLTNRDQRRADAVHAAPVDTEWPAAAGRWRIRSLHGVEGPWCTVAVIDWHAVEDERDSATEEKRRTPDDGSG